MAKHSGGPPDGGYLFPRIARVLRERAGIKLGQMADLLSVSPSAITQYEKPDTPITEETLRRYSEALGMPIEKAICDGVQLLSPAPEAAQTS